MKKELMIKTLFELIKNSKRSDREIARSLGLWQSTITRYRKRLEKEGVIREYTLVPNLQKMGYKILAFTFMRTPKKGKISNEVLENKIKEWVNDFPEVTFSTRVQGGGWNAVIISLHKSYTQYSEYFKRVLDIGEDVIEDTEVILASLDKESTLKQFSFRYLEKSTFF